MSVKMLEDQLSTCMEQLEMAESKWNINVSTVNPEKVQVLQEENKLL